MSRNRKKNIKKKKNSTKKTVNKRYIKPTITENDKKTIQETKQEKQPDIKKDLFINLDKRVKKLNNFICFLILFAVLTISCSYVYLIYRKDNNNIVVKDVILDDEHIVVKLNKNAMCALDEEKNWIESKDYTCTFDFKDSINNIYTKDANDKVVKHDIKKEFSIVDEIIVSKNKMYIALNGSEKIEYTIASRGNVKNNVTFSSEDTNIATVTDAGTINALSNGTTKIHVNLMDKESVIEVVVTDLIVPKPSEFNYSKKYLTCNQYSKEENDLLDEILKERVNSVGIKTKAALVEVARFITLEFPYRLSYFSENGRINAYGKGIDGEGRYYHEGLYLNSSRYSVITKSLYGPGTWGCKFYSTPAELIQNNGLDCSGFISWIFKNAGFDVGDLGAGISSGKDFTDLGERVRMTTALEEGIVKVGDLLSQEPGGEHIALIAGMKDGYFYVAESLWYGTGYLGAVLRKYDKAELIDNFYWLVDMKDFYESEGKMTDYWIN